MLHQEAESAANLLTAYSSRIGAILEQQCKISKNGDLHTFQKINVHCLKTNQKMKTYLQKVLKSVHQDITFCGILA